MNHSRHGPDGFALPAALFALIVLSILVTGGALLARQELRIGQASEGTSRAAYLAEEGITEVLLEWSSGGFGELAVTESETMSGTADGGTWTVEVLRTADHAYFLSSAGTVTRGGPRLAGATRELGRFVRIMVPDLSPPGAIATTGSMVLAGSSEVEGHDTDPPEWDDASCTTTAEDKPGILIDDSTNIERKGSNYEIDGDPPVAQDTAMTPESLLDFGGPSWEDVVGMASKTYPDGASIDNTRPDSVSVDGGHACRTSTQSNWGDPESPDGVCHDYFPIIHAAGDMTINSSSSGQGILLVDGDLRIQGGYEFYGVVIVKGTFVTAGTGGHVHGGVIGANADLDASTVTGNALVTNSTCVVDRAVRNNPLLTRPVPLAERSWVDLTGVSF